MGKRKSSRTQRGIYEFTEYIGRGKPGVRVPHLHVKAGRTGSGCYSALPRVFFWSVSVSRTRTRARYLMDWDKGLNDRLVGSLTRAWYGHCCIGHPITEQ
jgi:hypothetical protein